MIPLRFEIIYLDYNYSEPILTPESYRKFQIIISPFYSAFLYFQELICPKKFIIMYAFNIILALAASSLSFVVAQDTSTQKIGYSGTLSSLDGGLGGIVSVVDSKTLKISNYKLEDASAPALYWWGSTTNKIQDGFRISNARVSEKAMANTLTINLDSGKTSADFVVVGLWCERFSLSYGIATLAATNGNGTTASPASTSTGAASTTTAAKTGGARGGNTGVFGAIVAVAAVFGALLLL
jgi:hypothetical protein